MRQKLLGSSMMRRDDLSEKEQLTFAELLGEGTFGKVYKGECQELRLEGLDMDTCAWAAGGSQGCMVAACFRSHRLHMHDATA